MAPKANPTIDRKAAQNKSALAENANVTYAPKRIRCGWGDLSLVEATLYAVEFAVKAFPRATQFICYQAIAYRLSRLNTSTAFLMITTQTLSRALIISKA